MQKHCQLTGTQTVHSLYLRVAYEKNADRVANEKNADSTNSLKLVVENSAMFFFYFFIGIAK